MNWCFAAALQAFDRRRIGSAAAKLLDARGKDFAWNLQAREATAIPEQLVCSGYGLKTSSDRPQINDVRVVKKIEKERFLLVGGPQREQQWARPSGVHNSECIRFL